MQPKVTRITVCHHVCRKHHLHQLHWLFMFLHVPSSPAECRCDSDGNNRVSGDAHGDGDATPRHGARKRSDIIRSEPKKRSCGEPLTVLWCLAPCMFNILNFKCKSNKNMIAVKGKNKHFLVMMIKCVHDMTRTSHIYIYIYIYEQRTKPITSAKGRGWNGFLCVPHRSWGCNVCNKIGRTCVSRVIVFCVTPIVPESFMMVSSINVLVQLFQNVGGFGGRSYKYLNTKKYIRIRTSLVNNTVYTKGIKIILHLSFTLMEYATSAKIDGIYYRIYR